MNSLACLIDPLDTNGYVVAWAVGEDSESAISALKDKVVGQTISTMSIGHFTVDEDLWDRLRATYDGDLDDDGDEESNLILEVQGY